MRPYPIALRIGGIIVLSLLFAFLIMKEMYFSGILVIIGIAGFGYSLYSGLRKSLNQMEQMIANIRYGDLNVSFPETGKEGAGLELKRAMNEALSAFRARLYQSVVTEAETEAWQKLIRVLTHEIMNSIAPVISLSETITERASTNEMNEKDYAVMLQAMQTIHRRSKGLLDFVGNYRELTRIPTPVRQPFAVESFFKEIAELLQTGEVNLSWSVRPESLHLNADRTLMDQVLINLLKNALEACDSEKKMKIHIDAVSRENMTIITVSDNGPGIVPEALDKIFVPFFTTKPGGSGIGLSICRQIVNRHGGDMSIRSEAGKGTSVVIRIPDHYTSF